MEVDLEPSKLSDQEGDHFEVMEASECTHNVQKNITNIYHSFSYTPDGEHKILEMGKDSPSNLGELVDLGRDPNIANRDSNKKRKSKYQEECDKSETTHSKKVVANVQDRDECPTPELWNPYEWYCQKAKSTIEGEIQKEQRDLEPSKFSDQEGNHFEVMEASECTHNVQKNITNIYHSFSYSPDGEHKILDMERDSPSNLGELVDLGRDPKIANRDSNKKRKSKYQEECDKSETTHSKKIVAKVQDRDECPTPELWNPYEWYCRKTKSTIEEEMQKEQCDLKPTNLGELVDLSRDPNIANRDSNKKQKSKYKEECDKSETTHSKKVVAKVQDRDECPTPKLWNPYEWYCRKAKSTIEEEIQKEQPDLEPSNLGELVDLGRDPNMANRDSNKKRKSKYQEECDKSETTHSKKVVAKVQDRDECPTPKLWNPYEWYCRKAKSTIEEEIQKEQRDMPGSSYQSVPEGRSLLKRSYNRKYNSVGAIRNRLHYEKELEVVNKWPATTTNTTPDPPGDHSQLKGAVSRSSNKVMHFCKSAIQLENREMQVYQDKSDFREFDEEFMDLFPFITIEYDTTNSNDQTKLRFQLNEITVSNKVINLDEDHFSETLFIQNNHKVDETITLHSVHSFDNEYCSNRKSSSSK